MGWLKIALALATCAPAAAAAADRSDRWANEIASASARFQIPEAWIRRVMKAESGGRTMIGGRPIVSAAGAMGLMQLMPGTWREMRDLLGLGSNPHDPSDNIVAGTAYLRRMYDRFGYPGLFAAYNAGPARYGAFLAGRAGLPRETRTYVAAVAGPPAVPSGAMGPPSLFALGPARRSPGNMMAAAPAASALFVALGSPDGR